MNNKQKQLVLKMARRRFNLPTARASVLRTMILSKYPAAMRSNLSPAKMSRYDVLKWFVEHFEGPLPPKTKPIKRQRQVGDDFRQHDEFLLSYAWRKLRMEVIKERGARCECCGATPSDGTTVINVDHIKPRLKFPELALTKTNLQVLCGVCNHGKGNWDQTDWRAASADPVTAVTVPVANDPFYYVLKCRACDKTEMFHALTLDEAKIAASTATWMTPAYETWPSHSGIVNRCLCDACFKRERANLPRLVVNIHRRV